MRLPFLGYIFAIIKFLKLNHRKFTIMKKTIFISIIAILLTGSLAYSTMAADKQTENESTYSRVKIYLKNDCSSDVEVYVKSPGSSSKYTVRAGYKTAFEFLDGTKVYDEDGRNLIVEVTSSCSNKTYYVCD